MFVRSLTGFSSCQIGGGEQITHCITLCIYIYIYIYICNISCRQVVPPKSCHIMARHELLPHQEQTQEVADGAPDEAGPRIVTSFTCVGVWTRGRTLNLIIRKGETRTVPGEIFPESSCTNYLRVYTCGYAYTLQHVSYRPSRTRACHAARITHMCHLRSRACAVAASCPQ